jgi:tetratricopeptide (TPR) repeat protein
MLTPDGRVLLLDFGLAAAEGSARLTGSGAHVGSLAWMSPEQVRGQHADLDGRTDVYSLGATLFELLALRPPFARGAAEETRARILEGRALPLRDLNPTVPRDAETVCLKAMEADRRNRYAGAADFAADLQAALELRPVAARRPSAALRAWRWAQRKPAAAAALLLGALVLVAGPLGYELSQQRARARTERHFQAALQAIGHVLRETATEDLEDVPRMQRARLAAIDRALELFPALEADRPDDPLVRGERAALLRSRGAVLRDLGRPEEALAEFRREVELQRLLLTAQPGPEREEFLADALQRAGKALAHLLRPAEGAPLLAEAVALQRRALSAAPGAAARRLVLARHLDAEAETRRLLGEPDAAEALLREALGLVGPLRAGAPADADVAWTAGRLHDDLAEVLTRLGRPAEALAEAEQLLAEHRAAAAAAPERRFFAFDVATGLHTCAGVAIDLGRPDAALPPIDEALALVEALCRDYPESERYDRLRGALQAQGAEAANAVGDDERVAALLEPLLATSEARCAADSARCDLQLEAAIRQANLANALVLLGREPPRSEALAAAAVARMRACDEAGALPAGARGLLDFMIYVHAVTLCRLGDVAAARAAAEAFEARAGGDPAGLRSAADIWNEWLLLRRRAAPGDPTRAADEDLARARLFELLGRAMDAGWSDLEDLEGNPTFDVVRDTPEFEALLQRTRARRAGP